jgi:hypothetical protein
VSCLTAAASQTGRNTKNDQVVTRERVLQEAHPLVYLDSHPDAGYAGETGKRHSDGGFLKLAVFVVGLFFLREEYVAFGPGCAVSATFRCLFIPLRF